MTCERRTKKAQADRLPVQHVHLPGDVEVQPIEGEGHQDRVDDDGVVLRRVPHVVAHDSGAVTTLGRVGANAACPAVEKDGAVPALVGKFASAVLEVQVGARNDPARDVLPETEARKRPIQAMLVLIVACGTFTGPESRPS